MRRWKSLVALLALASPLQAQQFGAAVSIQDGEILVGEPLSRGGPATIYRYAESDGEWEQVGAITAPPPSQGGDFFGRFIEFDDQSMLIGGTLYENSTGGVWVYRRDGDRWQFETILQPDAVGEEEAFGRFGHLRDGRLFVSALGFQGVGAVWVFDRDESGAWTETALLQPDEPTPQEFFGWELAYDGEQLIVGSFANEEGTGAAYVFAQDGQGDWFQEARLALDEDESQPRDVGFPGSGSAGSLGVAWFEGMALLGLPGRDGGTGSVYTFTRRPESGAWVRGTGLVAFERVPGAFFGHRMLPMGGQLWISAPGEGDGGQIYRFRFDAAASRFEAADRFGNDIEAEPGDGFGATIYISGDLAVVGQPGDDNGLGSVIVMRADGDGWVPQAKLLIPGEPSLPAIVGGEVVCSDEGTADQFGCTEVDILSFLPVVDIGGGRGIGTNDVWGWTDPDSGREYAIVGRTDGTAFVDVSDPIRPAYLGSLPKTRGTQTTAWRDMKVFGDHAFVVADGAGQHGMQVFDLARLREVGDVPVEFDADAVYEGVASVHNIAINESTGIAYLVGANSGGETCGGGLHMVDVNEPQNPTFVGCFQDLTTGRRGTGYTHDAMCIVYDGPDEEHVGREICFGSNENALSIADVTDKEAPVALSSATYPNSAYAHQGWITDDHRYFFMGDELDEGAARREGSEWEGTRTLIWDVSDLDDPILAKEHFGETFTTDHNLYIRGNLMYQSNYVSGLRILNISDPLNPLEVGFLDTVPANESTAMSGSWSNYPFFQSGTIVVTSRQEGIFLLRHSPRELLP